MFKSSNLLLLQVLEPPSDDSSSDEMDVPTLKTALQTLSLKCSSLEHLKMIYTSDVVLKI